MLRTNRSVAKRFRRTKSGKFKKRNAGRGHILRKKTRKHKRQLRATGYISSADAKQLRRLLPYA